MDIKPKKAEDICTGLAVFTFLLAWSILFDNRVEIIDLFKLSNFINFYHYYNFSIVIYIITCIVAVWAIVKPSSPVRFLALVILGLVGLILKMPLLTNHGVFEIVVFITILISFLYLRFREKNEFTKTKFYEFFAPVLRIELIVLYFWAAVHKFNTGFFDLNISCAPAQYYHVKTVLTFLPVSDWTLNFSIYGTLVIEILIPLLLIIPRTRVHGLILGILFHSILGLKYRGFSALVFAMYSLFIPLSGYELFKTRFIDFRDRISDRFPAISKYMKWEKKYYNNFITQAIIIVVILYVLRAFFMRAKIENFGIFSIHSLVIAYLLIVAIFFFLLIRVVKPSGINQRGIMVPRVKWLLIFPLIIFLNGLSPHLGLKNVQVLAMFSNLRTEGGMTNHLFIPSSFQVFNTLDDLVTIKRSNYKGLDVFSGYQKKKPWWGTIIATPASYIKYMRENDKDFPDKFKYKIPFFLLQNIITAMKNKGIKNINLEYERGGEVFSTYNAERNPDLTQASIFQRKFLFLRAVPDDDRGLCMW